MSEINTAEGKFVTQEVFNAYVENFNNRLHDEARINDTRIERIEAIIEKALTIMHADNERLEERLNRKIDAFAAEFDKKIDNLSAEVNQKYTELDGKIKTLDKKIDKVEDTLSLAIMGTHDRIDALEKRFDDMKEYQNKWFTLFGILFTAAAILAPVAVAIVQKVVK